MKYKVLIVFLLTLFVIATMIVSTSNMRQTPTAAKPTPTAAKPTPTAAKPTAAKSTYPIMKGNVVPQNFTNRRYTAGIDIPVGLYHSTGTVCGYRINTAENEVFYVTIYEKGSTVVELKKGDQLSNSECSIVFGPPTPQSVILPGSHLVGVDIEPGVYHAQNNLTCQFAITTKEIITRGNETIKVGFGNLNGVRDMLIPEGAEAVFFTSECGEITKVS